MITNYSPKIGYDTIRLYKEGSSYQHIKNTLATHGIALQKKKEDNRGGYRYVSNALIEYNGAEIRFGFNKFKTTISFEPASVIYGTNFPLVGIREAQNSILAICGLLEIPVREFRFSRLDITANFCMEEKPIGYYTSLFAPPSYMKLQKEYVDEDIKNRKNGNVYYAGKPKGSNRTVVVYQKKNMMRIEMRFLEDVKRNIGSMLKYENLASALYEKEFYQRAVEYYSVKIVEKMCKGSPSELISILEQLENYRAAVSEEEVVVREISQKGIINQAA